MLFVCCIARMVNGTRLMIDWHNYGYSILRVNRVNKMVVFLGKLYEKFLGKFGDENFCVSQAMRTDLFNQFNVKASVLYDTATPKFNLNLTQEETNQLFIRSELWNCVLKEEKQRPFLLLSSTSYTADENFMLLVEALD